MDFPVQNVFTLLMPTLELLFQPFYIISRELVFLVIRGCFRYHVSFHFLISGLLQISPHFLLFRVLKRASDNLRLESRQLELVSNLTAACIFFKFGSSRPPLKLVLVAPIFVVFLVVEVRLGLFSVSFWVEFVRPLRADSFCLFLFFCAFFAARWAFPIVLLVFSVLE